MPRRPLLLALAALSLAACRDGGATDVSAIAGVYTLRLVDGRPLPADLPPNGGVTLRLVSGSVTLNADRTYDEETVQDRITAGGTTRDTFQSEGTYDVDGSAVVFRAASGQRATASLSGSSLTFVGAGATLAYTR